MKKIKNLFIFLEFTKKRSFFLIVSSTFVLGLIELTSIFSIMPFISLIVNPEYLNNNLYFAKFKNYYSFDNNNFIVFFGILILFLNFLANFLNAFVNWYINIFVFKFNEGFTNKLFKIYLNQPYNFFIRSNSADLKKNLISEIDRIVGGLILPLVWVISKAQILIIILLFLVFYDFVITISIFVFFIIVYGSVYLLVRSKIKKMGEESTIYLTSIFKLINHAFSDIKYIKLMGYENKFLYRFAEPLKKYTQYSAVSNIISQIPKYLVEFLSFAIIILLSIFLVLSGYGQNTLATLSLYAFAGYKLMPIIQQIFLSIVQVRYNNKAYQILINEMNLQKSQNTIIEYESLPKIEFNKYIKLKNISFKHQDSNKIILQNINIKILKNNFVCFVGDTGCGKSTLLDIISQIHIQDEGNIYVDDLAINEINFKLWQKKIGYVPQFTNLFDGTILQNITFNLNENDKENIDLNEIIQIVNLEDFVKNLPNGLHTNIGEMGVKISGGQKQRISIARALFQNPEILIFDEPTSALDKNTELKVINNIKNYYKDKTIIMVSHNENIIQHSDEVCFLKNGNIEFFGTYQDYLIFNKNEKK